MGREYTSPLFSTDNQYLKYYIYVWEDSTNVINNTSHMSVSVIALRTNTGYTTNYGGGCAIKLDGVEQASQYWDWGEKPVSYESYTTLYETSYWDQAHDSNGTKTMNIAASCWWYSNGSVYIDSAWQSFNVTLTAIDRGAPTVTISTSNVGVNSFSLSASTGSTTCDVWQRSIDNGSTWTQFSTTAGTSASTTVTGLSPNTTYNVKVRARRQYNQVYGTSGTSSVKTIGNSVLNSVSTVTADNSTVSFTINTTVYVPSYTHKLEIKNGNTSILTKTGLTLASGNNTITLTSSERTTLLNAMANIKNFTGTFNLSTWSGSTQIGSTTSKTATVQTTAANSAPTFTGFTYVDGNSTSTAVTENNQILIGGISTITVTANAATAKNSATIKSYSLVFGSTTASSTTTTITTGTITNTGTVALTVSAVDSRGYSTSQTVNVTSLPYSKIVFKTSSLRRVNEVENTIQLAFTGEMKDITISNVDKNSVQVCQYRYKKTSDNDYGSWTSIISGVTRSGNNLSYINDSLTTLDANYSWNVQVNITDRLTSDTITLTVGQGTPLMSWRTKKVGINNKNPQAALDINGDIYFTNSGTNIRQLRGIVGDNDYFRVAGGATAANSGWMEIATADDGNEPIYARQYSGAFGTVSRSLTLLDGSGDTVLPYELKMSSASGQIQKKAVGSYCSSQTTVAALLNEVRYSNGCCGSVNLAAYTGSPSSLPAAWYNFQYIPHRWGGNHGAADGDNCNYGTLMLYGMTGGSAYQIRYSNASISFCREIYTRAHADTNATANYLVLRDGNGDTRQRYAYTTHVNQSSSDQTTTCTGASSYTMYCNSDGWLRKSKRYSQLWSGTFTNSGSITVGGYGIYTAFEVIGSPSVGSYGGYQTHIIPANVLSTGGWRWCFGDDTAYYTYVAKYSGSNFVITYHSRSHSDGAIIRVFGIV